MTAGAKEQTGRPQAAWDKDAGLFARHAAALCLLRKGAQTDGALLLSYVVWPTRTPRLTDR